MTDINITQSITLKDVMADSGDIDLQAGEDIASGNITQGGMAGFTLIIPGDANFEATGDITLNAGNDFDQPINAANSTIANGDGVVTIEDGESVTVRDINDIIIDASDSTTQNILTDLTVISDAGTIFVEDNNLATDDPVTITSTSFQSYQGNVVLEQDTIMNSTGGGNITFTGTINSDTNLGGSARDLQVNTTGTTSFNGAFVGNVAPLDMLTTDDPTSGIDGGVTELTGTFFTVTSQRHFDAVTIESDVIINTATALFDDTLDSVSQ